MSLMFLSYLKSLRYHYLMNLRFLMNLMNLKYLMSH